MNKFQFNYMLEDTKLGIKRNRGSVFASITLLFIALCLIGIVLLSRAYMNEAIDYVESQLSMKVYVEQGMAQDVAEIISKQSYASNVEIETSQQMVEGLAFFFKGREHLLEAFTDGSVADAVKFQVSDSGYLQVLQQNLEQVDGIQKVVYPQQVAEILMNWIHKIELYGTMAIVILMIVAYCMVYSSFHLAMYQRAKELKMKLFLGMNPAIVRMQFLLEGLFLGTIGAILAILLSVMFYYFVFVPIQNAVPFIGQLVISQLVVICVIQLVIGIALGMLASYFSTRKLIRHV